MRENKQQMVALILSLKEKRRRKNRGRQRQQLQQMLLRLNIQHLQMDHLILNIKPSNSSLNNSRSTIKDLLNTIKISTNNSNNRERYLNKLPSTTTGWELQVLLHLNQLVQICKPYYLLAPRKKEIVRERIKRGS